ncbi:hypothetical protein [Mycolicibacterium sp. P1-5]|uniref:hypothetical protein n=1 Tax=Mycolicibacterium sp. P1-5 TaxID=2024617 RepID=UPI0011EC49C1|nr:hypothetical protein [Mycolicibacterium sp. P1-5]KAA0110230.1 hypothetical protein CIW47_08555 [Mycolicibacterium sp. P1-5]
MADGDLLELRVHGVNNTPPVSMLFAVQQEYGDSLVGIYRQRPTRGVVKALSWGGLARLSPFPRLPVGKWLSTAASAGWILVIPFGLANVAYWSRRVTLPTESYKTVRTTARLTRLFSLGLTLLLIASVCSASLDMTEGRIHKLLDSTPRPKWITPLTHTDIGDRMAILSLAPVLVMSLLWVLAKRTRTLYDRGRQLPIRTEDRDHYWKIGTRSFWDNADLSAHNTGIHTAAGLALSLLWTGQFWWGEHTGFGRTVVGLAIAILLACIGLTLTTPMATEQDAIHPFRRRFTGGLEVVAGVAFGVQFVGLICWHSPSLKPQQLGMFSVVPGVIVYVLLALAISALGWRQERRTSYGVASFLILIGIGALVTQLGHRIPARHNTWFNYALIGVLVVVAVVWAGWLRWHHRARAAEAWHGSAPGVLMILALFAAIVLSTVFVVVAAALLGDGNFKISQTEYMTAPPIYLSFATMLIPALVAIALVIAIMWVAVARCKVSLESDLDQFSQPTDDEMICCAEAFDHGQPASARNSLYSRRCRTRRVASLLHRAEPMGACLAVIATAAIVGGLALAVLQDNHLINDAADSFYWLQKFGVGAALLIGAFIVGHGVTQGRPLGIVWDLICFLPRAAHPFGPPCYAQRAIPELHTYCRAWLDSPPSSADNSRRLILSAHSLGGVLAVAVVLLLSDKYRDRVALVTYGCQLRAYFSRIFPELLGPRILGVTDSSPARLLKCPTFPPDPPTVSSDDNYPLSVLNTLRDTNGTPRWINLWRPTDYLGFPVYSRQPGNPIDRAADEVTAELADEGEIVEAGTDIDARTLDPSELANAQLAFTSRWIIQIDTHSDYFRARQYPSAVSELARRLIDSTTPRGKGPPGVP